MKKDKQKHQQPIPPQPAQEPLLSKTQWKAVAIGILVVAAGFWVLTKADTAGNNWASHAAPFLILGGYAIIGLALWNHKF